MASLETTKKIMESMDSDSFLHLVAKVLFKDIDDVMRFKTTDSYYLNDVVLIPASVTGESVDNLYVCIRNGVTGAFQKRDWRLFTLVPNNLHGFMTTKKYVAPSDNTSSFKLGVEISLDKHQLLVTHSVRGKLVQNTDWKLTDNNTITFIGFTLFEGESVVIDFYE